MKLIEIGSYFYYIIVYFDMPNNLVNFGALEAELSDQRKRFVLRILIDGQNIYMYRDHLTHKDS